LGKLDAASQYSVLYAVDSPRSLALGSSVEIEVRQGTVALAKKTLHAGDPDYYMQLHVRQTGAATLVVRASQSAGTYKLQVNRWPLSRSVRSGLIHRRQDAAPLTLGRTVFASGDDELYLPLPGTP